MHNRLYKFVIKNEIPNENQSGFQVAYSPKHAKLNFANTTSNSCEYS